MGRTGLAKYQKEILKLIGENGENAFHLLWEIANGRASYKKLVRDPPPDSTTIDRALIPMVEIFPTFKERQEAMYFLVEHAFGKPRVEVDVNVSDETKRDYGALTDEELAQLKTTLSKVGVLVDSVDAEFTEEKQPPALPEPKIVTLHDMKDAGPLYEELYQKLYEEPREAATRNLESIFAGKRVRTG